MIAVQNRIGSNIKRLRATLERFEGGRDILRSPNFESNNIEANRAGRGLSFAHFQHRGGIAGIGHDRQMAQTGDNLAQEFEPLAGKIGGLGRQAGDVAARSRQAWYEAGADRIVRRREHDRDNRCHLLCRKHRPSHCYDHIDLESDELSGNLAEALGTSLRPTILDRQGATLDPAEFAQSLNKGGGPLALGCRRGRAHVPDGRQPRRLLRARSAHRRAAWLRIFVVGCSLPCDPPVEGHSCNGGSYHASIARSVAKASTANKNHSAGVPFPTNSFSAADLEPQQYPLPRPPADEVALALRLAHPENLAPPEVLRSELRSFDKSAQLSPGKLGVNAASKAAIRAGNYILATDNRGIAKDAIGDQLRMLDEVGRMTYDTRHQYLAGRHLDHLPGSPLVLMSHVAGLEGIGLRLNRENQIDDVFQRQVVSMRTVPAAPTKVVTHLLFRNADERVIDCFDAQLGELAVLFHGRLGLDHVPPVGKARIVDLQHESR